MKRAVLGCEAVPSDEAAFGRLCIGKRNMGCCGWGSADHLGDDALVSCAGHPLEPEQSAVGVQQLGFEQSGPLGGVQLDLRIS